MVVDLVSLSDASGILGVSAERVRQLVVAGELPGRRFGNAWVVPKDALLARRHAPHAGGRPLAAVRAWDEIVAGSVDLDRPGRYQRRAEVVRCEMSQADLDSLPRVANARVSGVRAAIEYGASLIASDDSDMYLSRAAFDVLDSRVAMVRDPLGSVRLRVVDDAAWEAMPRGAFAPRGAVALDLLDSGDPRHWVAAEQLVADA